MAQITWRNIEAPDFRGAGSLVNAAGNGLTAMTGAFQKAIADVQAGELAAKNTRIADNTNEFMNSLYANYRDPASLQTAMADGSIAKAMAGFGKEIDFNTVRGAADTRLAQQMQQATAIRTDQQAALKAQQAPLLGQHAAAVRSGDTLRAQALAAQMDPTSLDQASKVQFDAEGEFLNRDKTRNTMQNENTRTGIAVAGNARQEAMHPLEMAAKRASTTASLASANASNASAQKSKAELGVIGSDKLNRQMLSTVVSNLNTEQDKQAAAVNAAIKTGKYDTYIGPPDADGNRNLGKVSPAALDAMRSSMAESGLNLDAVTGAGDGALLTRAKKTLTAAGYTGKPEDTDAYLKSYFGQGREILQKDTPAGQRETARLANELKDAQGGSGTLVSARNTGEVLQAATKGLSKEFADKAMVGFTEAFAEAGGHMKGKNGEKLILDANTLNQLAFEVVAGGGSFGWLGTDARANHFKEAAINYMKRKQQQLKDLKNVSNEEERARIGDLLIKDVKRPTGTVVKPPDLRIN